MSCYVFCLCSISRMFKRAPHQRGHTHGPHRSGHAHGPHRRVHTRGPHQRGHTSGPHRRGHTHGPHQRGHTNGFRSFAFLSLDLIEICQLGQKNRTRLPSYRYTYKGIFARFELILLNKYVNINYVCSEIVPLSVGDYGAN